MAHTFLYAAVGPTVISYVVDAAAGRLRRVGSTDLPANVQYAQSHTSGTTLYVVTSDGGPGFGDGTEHQLHSLRINPSTGELTSRCLPVTLPARPIHVTVDSDSRHVLVTFNLPPTVRVYAIAADQSAIELVDELRPHELGSYPHQSRVTADGRRLLVACRGSDPRDEHEEQPGSLHVVDYRDGQLGDRYAVAPHHGFGFGPRDVDFHPSLPRLYVALERQNELAVFGWASDGTLEGEPRWQVPTMTGAARGRQLGGPVHVHPRGHVAYAANRAPGTAGDRVLFPGGDNTIAVYALDESTGEPKLLQYAETAGVHARTFQIDPTGTLLVAAHVMAAPTGEGPERRTVPAGLSIFRITADGRLALLRRYELDLGAHLLFWMGITQPAVS